MTDDRKATFWKLIETLILFQEHALILLQSPLYEIT